MALADDEKIKYKDRAQSLYNWFAYAPVFSMFSNRSEGINNVRFIQGIVDYARYSELKDTEKSHVKDATAVNISPRVLNVVSKPFRLLKGKLSKAKFEPQVNPSVQVETDVQVKRARLLAIRSLNLPPAQLERVKMMYGIQDIPDTDEDVDIVTQVEAKDEVCMKHESDLIDIARNNNLDDQIEQGDWDLLAFGFTAFEVRKKNGKIYQEQFDAKDLICGYFEKDDASDLTEAARTRFLTLSQIKEESIKSDGTPEFTEDDFVKIKQQEILPYGMAVNYPYYTPNFKTDGVIKVVNYYWASDATTFYQKSTTRFGNSRLYPRDWKGVENKKNAFALYKPMVYTCSWIVGTDLVYNCRPLPECTYIVDSVFKYEFPIKIVAPLIKFGRPMPIISEIVELGMKANLAWHKMEEDMANARPLGYAIDQEALASVAFNFKGSKMDAEKLADMAITRNVHFYNGKNLNGASNGRKPVEVVQGGVSSTFMTWIETIRFCMQEIEYLTAPDQSLNNPNTLKGTAEINQINSQESIQHLFSAKKKMYEMIQRATLIFKLQDEPIQPVFQITCDQMPTQEEWMEFNGLVQLALKTPIEQGGISASDASLLYSIKNLKQANKFLRLVIKRNKKEGALLMQQSQQMASQMSAQQAQEKLASELSVVDKKGEWQYKIAELQVRGTIASTEHKGEIAMERANQTAVHKQTLEEQKATNDMLLNEHSTDEEIFKDKMTQPKEVE